VRRRAARAPSRRRAARAPSRVHTHPPLIRLHRGVLGRLARDASPLTSGAARRTLPIIKWGLHLRSSVSSPLGRRRRCAARGAARDPERGGRRRRGRRGAFPTARGRCIASTSPCT
jgi:hypothetical protein